jgi:serine/threonine protein phosphatase PrpC
MEMEIATISLTGDRENNEDYAGFVSSHCGSVFVVADGLGGRAFGEWASEAFTEGMLTQQALLLAGDYTSRDAAKPVFETAFVRGAKSLRDKVQASDATADPQTTAVVAVVTDKAIGIGHIGDSRAYQLTRSGVVWRSRDHSLVELLLSQGEITEAQMGTHPDQGKLFKVIGMGTPPAPSVMVLSPLVGEEALLLCSDGFWEYLLPGELTSLVESKDLDKRLDHLAHTAVGRAAGKSDNVTAICVRVRSVGVVGRF